MKMVGRALVNNPDLNVSQLSILTNAGAQQRSMTTEALPTVLSNVREAGKKVAFNDIKFVGKLQAYAKGQLNDPDFVNYMTQRNDAMLTIAQVMRGTGATDMSTKMENEAANPSMSPKAWDAWYNAQLHALRPRVAIAERRGLIEPGTLAALDQSISGKTGGTAKAKPAGISDAAWGAMSDDDKAHF
jgi:hypothetical protein